MFDLVLLLPKTDGLLVSACDQLSVSACFWVNMTGHEFSSKALTQLSVYMDRVTHGRQSCGAQFAKPVEKKKKKKIRP